MSKIKIFMMAGALMLTALCTVSFAGKSDSKEVLDVKGGYIYVYFENDCSGDITLKIKGNGSASSGTLYAGKKERKPVKAGYQIYADGSLVHTISDSDEGKTIVVCD